MIAALGPSLVAQTGNVVISTNTTYATGTYSLTSLTVENGATLTVGGGSTLTVSGAVLVTANSSILLQGANTSAQVNGAWAGVGSTINAGSVEVDTGSSINADAQGYTASSGPGAASGTSGGSYGGAGGGQAATTTYGNDATPTDLGSGGGSYESIGGTGGGALRLIVSGTLTDNGIISANGGTYIVCTGSGACGGGFAGGGAGGSIYVTAGTLTGSGTFNADGGPNATGNGGGGGGGRVAVYYTSATNFSGMATSTASGGTVGSGGAPTGSAGTVAFFSGGGSGNNGALIVDQPFTIPAGTTATYTAITVQNGATLTVGGGSTLTVSGAVLVTANSSIVLQGANTSAQVNGAWAGVGSTINAATIEVDTGSSINADAQGYTASNGPGAAANGTTNGGSYGGAGGGQAATTTYGNGAAPVDLGSGGGGYESIGGTGGGAIKLVVSGTLTNNGIISANGGTYIVCTGSGACGGGFAGGGAGGSIDVSTGGLAGSGTFDANGGSNSSSYGNGGGGGRVAVTYNASQSSFTGFSGSTANGGVVPTNNSPVPGSVGSVVFFDTSVTNDNVTVYQNFFIPAASSVQYNSLTVTNGALLTVGGGSTITVAGSVLVAQNSTVVLQSANTTAQVNGSWQGAGVTLKTGSVQVDAGSSINADGQGYGVSAGPGGAPSGTSAGGSYGGVGGSGSGPTPAAPIYGSDTMPTDLGSGGGSRCCGAIPGNGGGSIRLIVSGTLTDNGVISANGGNLVGYQGGGGSGGSVWVTTAGLAGSGAFTANGGTGGEAAGGGGRIAVYYNGPTSSFTGFTASTSNGGSCQTQCSNGTASAGSVGTVGFFDTSATNDNLMVDQDLTVPAGTTVSYNSITIQPGATLTIGGGSTVTVTNSLTVSGTVIAQSINNTAQVNNTWQGSGVVINAASVVVNTGGSINADGQGYVANAGPGGAPVASSAGGSYGGPGGEGDGAFPPGTYGSTTAPIDLGSGGGSRCCGTIPGAGGGALTFNVSQTFTNNGTVSANGGAVVGFQAGGGAGGSVYVATAVLAGSGAFTANGGVGGEAGGGGGRVAIYYNAPSSTFTGFAASTATGGACGANGNSGCSNGAASAGSNGTSAFFDTSATNNNLAIYQNFTIPAGSSPTYNSVTVQPSALLTIGGGATLTTSNALTVGGTVVAQSANNTAQVNGVWVGSGVAINAGSITVNSNGSLNADTQGYIANAGPGGSPGASSAGGSYGGLGGVGNGGSPSPTYGSLMEPIDLGSGGGSRCCGTVPGSGGGQLLLTVAGTLTDDGIISANGGDGAGLQVGGGSGGSVSIHTANLAGTGSIAANGGAGGEAGGGGGRIALYFVNNAFNLSQATATGGSSSDGNAGAAGTVYIPGKVSSTISLTASPTKVSLEQAVTIQAVVIAASPGPTPTGTVNFLDGTTVIGTGTLSASPQSGTANAQFQTTTLALGSHSITASYAGDQNVKPSTSAAQTVLVEQLTSTTSLGISASNITVAQSETLTAKVTGIASVAVTGNVTFFDGTVSLGTVNLTVTGSTGTAGLTVPSLAVGPHNITAYYNGDTNYTASVSGAQTVTVSGTPQTITFPPIPNHVYGDSPFALTATASSGLAVSFSLVSGPATVSGSVVTLTGTGTVTIQATQAGNTIYAAATPVSQSFTVTAPVPTLASISPTIGIVGSAATTITLTGTNFSSTDTVQLNGTAVPSTFVSATSLTATLPASFFAAAGTGLITVTDSASNAVTAAATFTVAPAPQFVLSGPQAATSDEQPALTFTLANPYPFSLAGTLTLTFEPVASAGVTGDPAVQFSTGGQTIVFNIPANSTATPAVQLQTGTIAGTATVTLAVTSDGVNLTPANVAPVVITIPAAVPTLNSATTTKSGRTLTVAVVGYSNTRELTRAVFHFTPVAGSSIENPDVTVDVSAIFADWYVSTASDAYGSAFTYTQPFTLDIDASSIAGVTVTLENSVGTSVVVTAP